MQTANIDDVRYIIRRKFTPGGWFEKAVNEIGGEEMAKEYGCDKLLRDPNGLFYLVSEISEVDILEEILDTTDNIPVETGNANETQESEETKS
jgi:hypothetical protein